MYPSEFIEFSENCTKEYLPCL